MPDADSLRKLAAELTALVEPDAGAAFTRQLDDDLYEVVADRDGLLQLARAFIQTALLAEEDLTRSVNGPSTKKLFVEDTDASIMHPAYAPRVLFPELPPVGDGRLIRGVVATVGFSFLGLALLGLVTVVRWFTGW